MARRKTRRQRKPAASINALRKRLMLVTAEMMMHDVATLRRAQRQIAKLKKEAVRDGYWPQMVKHLLRKGCRVEVVLAGFA